MPQKVEVHQRKRGRTVPPGAKSMFDNSKLGVKKRSPVNSRGTNRQHHNAGRFTSRHNSNNA